jgi:hypothetical protein
MEKFQYSTTIDFNMGYYSMPLDEEAKKLCVISLPWGLYQYQVLPQGIKPATDIFQARMNALYYDMNSVATFLDDIMALGQSTFTAHLVDITEVLKRLLAAGMQVNAAKCKWFNHAVTYLGFVITRTGIQPQPEKNSRYFENEGAKNAERSLTLCRHGQFLPQSISKDVQNY